LTAFGESVAESGRFTTMSTHQLDQAVFRPVLPEDIDWEPFPAFPPAARLAVVVQAYPPVPSSSCPAARLISTGPNPVSTPRR
jgi:hypothetical protein